MGWEYGRPPPTDRQRPTHTRAEGDPDVCARLCCTWDLTSVEVNARTAEARARLGTSYVHLP